MENLIIHGGLSEYRAERRTYSEINDAICSILEESFVSLQNVSSKESVINAISMLEDNPIFNAGTGSKLQNDGKIRMSAALMDGTKNIFSGVINIQDVKNPIKAASILSKEKHSVLCGDEGTSFCRKKGIIQYNPLTPKRLTEFQMGIKGKVGTVGAVAIDDKGDIFSGTSTGGIGWETPGRVSDSPTVAGTYASKKSGISCTGIGEQITQQAVAAKIVTRVDDGMKLREAVAKTIFESNKFNYSFGMIGLDYKGNFEVGKTETIDEVYYAFCDGKRIRSFYK